MKKYIILIMLLFPLILQAQTGSRFPYPPGGGSGSFWYKGGTNFSLFWPDSTRFKFANNVPALYITSAFNIQPGALYSSGSLGFYAQGATGGMSFQTANAGQVAMHLTKNQNASISNTVRNVEKLYVAGSGRFDSSVIAPLRVIDTTGYITVSDSLEYAVTELRLPRMASTRNNLNGRTGSATIELQVYSQLAGAPYSFKIVSDTANDVYVTGGRIWIYGVSGHAAVYGGTKFYGIDFPGQYVLSGPFTYGTDAYMPHMRIYAPHYVSMTQLPLEIISVNNAEYATVRIEVFFFVTPTPYTNLEKSSGAWSNWWVKVEEI